MENKIEQNNVITIYDGEWAGVQYIVRNIECIDEDSNGDNISFEYDLVSDLGDKKDEFELWFRGYIQSFLNAAMQDYINKVDA